MLRFRKKKPKNGSASSINSDLPHSSLWIYTHPSTWLDLMWAPFIYVKKTAFERDGFAFFGIMVCQPQGPNFPSIWATILALQLDCSTAALTVTRKFHPTENWLSSRSFTSVIVRELVFPSWYQPLTCVNTIKKLLTMRGREMDGLLAKNKNKKYNFMTKI